MEYFVGLEPDLKYYEGQRPIYVGPHVLIGFVRETSTGYQFRHLDSATFRGGKRGVPRTEAVYQLWTVYSGGWQTFPDYTGKPVDDEIVHWEIQL